MKQQRYQQTVLLQEESKGNKIEIKVNDTKTIIDIEPYIKKVSLKTIKKLQLQFKETNGDGNWALYAIL